MRSAAPTFVAVRAPAPAFAPASAPAPLPAASAATETAAAVEKLGARQILNQQSLSASTFSQAASSIYFTF